MLRVVQAIGVDLLLEWEQSRGRVNVHSDGEVDRLLLAIDAMAACAGAGRDSGDGPPDPDLVRERWSSVGECGWRSKADVVGSVVICLWTHDTESTFVHCGDGFQKYVFRVVRLLADNSADVVERDFLTYADAVAAFPEAAVRERK